MTRKRPLIGASEECFKAADTVILLDAYAIIAVAKDEPSTDQILGLISERKAAVVSINLAEVIDVLQRTLDIGADEVKDLISPTLGASFEVRPVDSELAWLAGDLRSSYYRRKERELSMADCCLLACAKLNGDTIVTDDRPILESAREMGLKVVALQ